MRLLAWAFCWAFFVLPVRAGDLAFSPRTLEVPEGRVIETFATDLDGDSRMDLLAEVQIGWRPEKRGAVAFFRQAEEGLPLVPTAIMIVKPDWVMHDVGEVAGERQWCVTDSDGLLCLKGSRLGADAQPERVIEARPLWRFRHDDPPACWDFIRDFNGDGRDDILIPVEEGLAVYQWVADGEGMRYQRGPLLAIPMDAYAFSGLAMSQRALDYSAGMAMRIPRLVSTDINGDGRPDLCALWREHVQCHLQKEDLNFEREPEARLFFNVLTQQEKRRGGVNFFQTLDDLNGDGLADLMMSKVWGGVREMQSRIEIRWGSSARQDGHRWNAEPDQVIKAEGYTGQQWLLDWDKDGRKEIILPNVEIGVFKMVGVLMSGTISVNYLRYGFKEGLYGAPKALTEFILPLDLSRGAIIPGMRPVFGYDFNGDARPDAASAPDPDTLVILLGQPDGSLDSETRMAVATSLNTHFADLNGDGATDIHTIFPEDAARERQIQLQLSVKPAKP